MIADENTTGKIRLKRTDLNQSMQFPKPLNCLPF